MSSSANCKGGGCGSSIRWRSVAPSGFAGSTAEGNFIIPSCWVRETSSLPLAGWCCVHWKAISITFQGVMWNGAHRRWSEFQLSLPDLHVPNAGSWGVHPTAEVTRSPPLVVSLAAAKETMPGCQGRLHRGWKQDSTWALGRSWWELVSWQAAFPLTCVHLWGVTQSPRGTLGGADWDGHHRVPVWDSLNCLASQSTFCKL